MSRPEAPGPGTSPGSSRSKRNQCTGPGAGQEDRCETGELALNDPEVTVAELEKTEDALPKFVQEQVETKMNDEMLKDLKTLGYMD
jgi:hypothetical protein